MFVYGLITDSVIREMYVNQSKECKLWKSNRLFYKTVMFQYVGDKKKEMFTLCNWGNYGLMLIIELQ